MNKCEKPSIEIGCRLSWGPWLVGALITEAQLRGHTHTHGAKKYKLMESITRLQTFVYSKLNKKILKIWALMGFK